MIRASFAHAFADLRDPAFRRMAFIGAGFSLALLFVLYALLIQIFTSFDDEVFTFSDGTRMDRLGSFFSVVSLATMLLLSVFLMAPAASLFTGLHLNAVADTIEAQHYPQLAQPAVPDMQKLWLDSIRYFVLVFVLNLFSFMGFAILGLLWGIILFWALNGWLLSREYSTMICERRADQAMIKAFLRQHRRSLVLTGTAFAILLSVPILNLIMPVIGVAAFTHLIHRLPMHQPEGAV